MPYTLWTSRQEYDVCMKRKNKAQKTIKVLEDFAKTPSELVSECEFPKRP